MFEIGNPILQGSPIPFREDMCHEFKSHSCISAEEVSFHKVCRKKQQSLRATSRTICGFLNTGIGGVILLGVYDNSQAIGLPMTPDQQQHILLSLADTLERYDPPVPRERLRVRFIPVLSTEEEALEDTSCQNESLTNQISVEKLHVMRRPHIHCWCFKEANALVANFVKLERFVLLILVLPWLELPPYMRSKIGVHTGFLDVILHPFYTDEEGNCYYRRQGSNQKLTDKDVIELTKLQAKSEIRKSLMENPKYHAWFRRK